LLSSSSLQQQLDVSSQQVSSWTLESAAGSQSPPPQQHDPFAACSSDLVFNFWSRLEKSREKKPLDSEVVSVFMISMV
jgi:hypothetical protein